jgi:hypothetical protein
MNDESVRTSSDLIRWLKMLALPGWAKVGLAAIMLLTLANALSLLAGGMLERDKDAIAASLSIDAGKHFEKHAGLHSCLVDAEREGYVLNPVIQDASGIGMKGFVFIKTLHEDFLLSPAQRLHFAQDLSFFVRGLLEASVQHD